MNLSKLFEMQKELDARIIQEKGLEGQDLLPNTVLALQVEIGELANEWRGFKHWSNDREPRTRVKNCLGCNGCETSAGCEICCGANPLLEEYVDCLHFFLSIARQLQIEITDLNLEWYHKEYDVTQLFLELFNAVSQFWLDSDVYEFNEMLIIFLTLSGNLGLAWDQIAEAYAAKNKVNHERQSNGY